MQFRDALTPPELIPSTSPAVIESIDADGTVGIDFGGGRTVDRCAVLATYTPVIGDAVEVLRRDGSSYLVLGAARDSNASTVTVGTSLVVPYNVRPAPPSGPSAPNPFIVDTVSTRSWRENEGWYRNDPRQGSYSTAWGYHRGCYFYGSSAFSALDGATCTRLRVTIYRDNHGGIAGPERVYIGPHVHASQPAGAPYFPKGAQNVGSLAWNGSGTFDLPVAWGQGLIDGIYKGLGHLYMGTADYSIYLAVGAQPLAGRITLDWK